VEGLPTVLPFHRAVLRDPAFVGDEGGFRVHTRWIETEFANPVPPFGVDTAADRGDLVAVLVGGRPLDVRLPGLDSLGAGADAIRTRAAEAAPGQRAGSVSGDTVAAPMQGTVVNVAVVDGQQVTAGDLLVVVEAMKMENPVTAHKAGTVTGLSVAIGDTVSQDSVLCKILD
jgi:acetyl-CoA/propionyl-CoA carboxylase biotin carboxyl carrier protein